MRTNRVPLTAAAAVVAFAPTGCGDGGGEADRRIEIGRAHV